MVLINTHGTIRASFISAPKPKNNKHFLRKFHTWIILIKKTHPPNTENARERASKIKIGTMEKSLKPNEKPNQLHENGWKKTF